MEQDIQLSGLGIQLQHAVIDIENSEVFVAPLPDARFEITELYCVKRDIS